MLFGDDAGTAEVAGEFNIRHVPDVKRNAYGTPLLNELFDAAEKAARYPLLCYVNADLILMADFLPAIRRVVGLKPRCLMICQRWDVTLDEELDFHPGWDREIKAYVARTGRPGSHTEVDCFVFPRGLWRNIPPFALGRGLWDNWLIYGARASDSPVIDLSHVVLAVHQDHDYSHQPHVMNSKADVWSTEEAKHNRVLGGGYAYAFSAKDATHILTRQSLKRNIIPYHLYRKLAMLSVTHPFLTPLVDLVRFVYQRYPAVGRALLLWRVK